MDINVCLVLIFFLIKVIKKNFILFFSADNPSQTLIIRTCALDSGTLTADTGKQS